MDPSRLSSGFGPAATVALAHVAVLVGVASWEGPVRPTDPTPLEASIVPASPLPSDEAPSPLPQGRSSAARPAEPGPATPPETPAAIPAATPSDPASVSVHEGFAATDAGPSAPPSAESGPAEGGAGSASPGDGDGDGSSEPTDYLSNPAPSYPLASRLLGEEGRVLLRVLVDTAGNSRTVVLHRSSGHPRLDGSALAAVWSWRFHPARRAGRVLEAWVIVPIRFSIKGAS